MRVTRRESGGRRKALHAHFVDGALVAGGVTINRNTWFAHQYRVRDATPEERKQLSDWWQRQPDPSAASSSGFRHWKGRDTLRFVTSRDDPYKHTKEPRVVGLGGIPRNAKLAITAICGIFLVLAILLTANQAPMSSDAEGVRGANASLQVPSKKPLSYESGIRVSGKAGQGKWPLRSISEGTIFCRWHEFAPGSRNPITRRPLVLFKAPSGRLYAVNGAAESAAAKGYVTAASINDIMVEQRLWLEVGKVLDAWLDAGLASCEGNHVKAQRLADKANRMVLESMSLGVDFELSSAEDEVRRRRIFFELVQCQDEAWKATQNDLDSRRVRVLERACFVKIREKEGLTEEELRAISEEGGRRLWPMP